MKHVRLFLLLTVIFCASCNKDSPTPPNLSGNWNWFATYLVYPQSSTNPQTPQNTSKTQVLSFVGKYYTIKENNQTISSGTYTTKVITSVYGDLINSIHYKTGTTDWENYYTISNDTLSYSEGLNGAVGAATEYYVKVK